MSNEELLTDLAHAMTAYDDAVKALIVDELESTIRPSLEAARDQAVARVADAYQALELPRSQVADTDEQITFAEKELSVYKADMESDSVSTRANARSFVTEWEAELSSLREKRDQQSERLKAFTDAHRNAKDARMQAEIALAGYKMNLEDPFYAWGAKTAAYQGYRIGSYPMWVCLLGNMSEHREFPAFFAALDDVAESTGYDTESLRERLLARAREGTQENFARDPEPVPSGREIIDSELTAIEVGSVNRVLENSPSRIEDHRSPIGAIPRNVTVPDHMKVPDISAEARRH